MATAVLISGGLDSAVLLAHEAAQTGEPSDGLVQPIYVNAGLAWERAERAALESLLDAKPRRFRVRPLVSLAVDMRDVYAAGHWAIEGRPPGYHTPDEDVYLPGRNIVLLGKAGVYCAGAHLDRLVLGTLAHNPFPDATPAFRAAMADTLSLGLGHRLTIDAPFASLEKAEVVRLGTALDVPLELTLSCMSPRKLPEPREPREPRYVHCGVCSKCRERHDAFVRAGVDDRTRYSDRTHVGPIEV